MSADLQKRLDRTKAAEAEAEDTRPLPNVDLFHSLSIAHIVDLFAAGFADQGYTLDKLEGILAGRRAEQRARETQERVATAKAQEQAEKLRIESNTKVFETVFPYLRAAPRDQERRFTVQADGSLVAIGDGVCTCGFNYRVNLLLCIDQLMARESKGLWFRRRHVCRVTRTDGSVDERTKMEPAVGVWLDTGAMTSAAVGRVRWSTGPPEAFMAERPVL